MKKNRRRERILAWIITVIVFLLLITGLVVGFLLLKDPVSSFIKNKFPQKEETIEEVAVEEEEAPEPEPEPVYEEEGLDQEALDQIFTEEEEEPEPEPVIDPVEEQVNALLAELSLEEKIAQMFFVRPEAITGVDVATAAGDKTKESLEKYPVGGIVLFKDNIVDPDQISEMTGNLQTYSKEINGLPMFIGVDEEGGRVLRIGGNDKFEVEEISDMKSIGESGDTQKAYDAGATIGEYLHKYGFNVDFAPDADVITEESNTVIGDRSFGTDAKLVSDMSLFYAEGLQSRGVFACPKHFPGHGGTKEDSHEGKAVSERTWDQLEEEELVPFQTMVDNGASFLMVSHICVPQVIGEEIPATLSSLIITDKLRNEMGYFGIVITDAMNMKAVSEEYSSAEAAVKAIEAGVDIILMPENFREAYEGVVAAVSEEDISVDRIDESVKRILRVKLSMMDEDSSEESEETAEEESSSEEAEE